MAQNDWNTLLFQVFIPFFVGYQGVQGHWNSWNMFFQLPYIRVTRTYVREITIKYFPRGEYKKGVPTVPLGLQPLTIKDHPRTFSKTLPVPSVPILLHPLSRKGSDWNTFLDQLFIKPVPIQIYAHILPSNLYIYDKITLTCYYSPLKRP